MKRVMSFQQRQFLTLMALAVVPLLFALGTVLPMTQRFFMQSTRDQLEIVADLKTTEVENWLEHGQDVATLITERVSHELTEKQISTTYTSPDELIAAARDDVLALILSSTDIFSEVRSISLLHPSQGHILISTDPTFEGRERGDEDYFRQGQEGLYISPVAYSVGREAPILMIAVPVHDTQGNLWAVIAIEMNVSDLETALANRSGLGVTGRVYLVEGYGFYVALSSETDGRALRTIAESEGVSHVLAGESGSDTYIDPQGVSVLGVYRWLPEVNLGLLVEIDESELTAQYTRIWLIVVVAELLLFLLAIGISRSLAGWLVAPLVRIAKAARALQAGDLSQRTDSNGPTEIRQMALAFNDMADSLQQSYENLEEQVQNRTQELTETNERLWQEIVEREEVQEELINSEKHYRTLFENVPVSIWEEDFSAVKVYMSNLREQGVDDFKAYCDQHPEVVAACVSGIKILDVNQSTLDLYDASSKEDLLKRLPTVALPEMRQTFHDIVMTLAAGQLHYEGETMALTLTGERLNVIMRLSVIPGYETDWSKVLVSITDITARKQVEESIKVALMEKETLLKEIHHRVKNNLQIISSLLHMQSMKIQDPDTLHLFRDSESRVHSMALIHEQLYQTDDLSQIDFKEYIEQLVRQVARLQAANKDIVLDMAPIDPISLTIETAVPCGLIINELVSNAYKHAFPNDIGKIQITLQAEDNDYILIVQDDGVGLPPNFDRGTTKTLGVRLLTMLVMQIDGTVDMTSSGGTKVVVRFPKKSEHV